MQFPLHLKVDANPYLYFKRTDLTIKYVASFRLQCCAVNSRDWDGRQSNVTCLQWATPIRPVRAAAPRGSGHPGLGHSAPTSYPAHGLRRVKTAWVTDCTVRICLGTKPQIEHCLVQRKCSEDSPLFLFLSANTGNSNQCRAPSCTQVASSVVLSAELWSLLHHRIPYSLGEPSS